MNLHFNPRRAVVYVSLSKCNVSRIQARFVLSGVTKASVEARTRDSARERDVRSRDTESGRPFSCRVAFAKHAGRRTHAASCRDEADDLENLACE